jgi:hypothetical protein
MERRPKPPAIKSQQRLATLGFDPMSTMVDTYRALEAEIAYQKKLRDGEIVELRADGKPKVFYPDHLYALYDRLTNISDKLMRYGYGRVPETNIIESEQRSPLVINLSTGGKKVINEEPSDG